MLVPLATDIPFNLDKLMAWKLLNHLSTASRSSSLQRSSTSRWRTCGIWGSITQLYSSWFWRFLLWRRVGLITEWCSKCHPGLGFKHFYSTLWRLLASLAALAFWVTQSWITILLWAVPLSGFWDGSDRPVASSRRVWCRSPCSRHDISRRPAQLDRLFRSSRYRSKAEDHLEAVFERPTKRNPRRRQGF